MTPIRTVGRRVTARVMALPPPVDPVTKRWTKLPIRVPEFRNKTGAVAWIYRTWPPDERHRSSFKVLYLLAGYLDADIDTPSIRELSHRCRLEPKRILQILVKLEREGWIICDWAKQRNERNWYCMNYDRRPVKSYDPYRSTYQPKRKDKRNGNSTQSTNQV